MGASWFVSARRALWLAVLLVLSAPALAQGLPNRFKGTNVVSTVGDDLEIHFTDPGMANKTVTIAATDGNGHKLRIKIKLNKRGVGSTKITTPDWGGIFLQSPHSIDHGIVVLP